MIPAPKFLDWLRENDVSPFPLQKTISGTEHAGGYLYAESNAPESLQRARKKIKNICETLEQQGWDTTIETPSYDMGIHKHRYAFTMRRNLLETQK